MRKSGIVFFILLFSFCSFAHPIQDTGKDLWLKYQKIDNADYVESLKEISVIVIPGGSTILEKARKELQLGLKGLLGRKIEIREEADSFKGMILAGTPSTLPLLGEPEFRKELSKLEPEGFLIKSIEPESASGIIVAANEDVGILYGIFHFLRLLQTEQSLENINIHNSPKLQWRMLNHWDNLDGTIERGYAGKSLWKWDELPEKLDPRYEKYARANASVGINAVVLNNVNANPEILSAAYLEKVAALAGVFRPYGIRLLLSANFASPKVIGGLETADPLDPEVIRWWSDKVDEIYEIIPDFGGFLVKANSEGQPGPQDYDRSHVQGANMMAEALAPHEGLLIWRAFVYSMQGNDDRAKMAYNEFVNTDGEFKSNVFLQIKNGPLDFQPREPFSPLFGAMSRTPQMMEFQITQEYLGHNKALVYLAPLFKEVLESDTYAEGTGSTVAKVIDGSLQSQKMTGIAGVANTGDDEDWTGYIFGQANWYAFGRIAWNHEISAEEIAREWIQMTIGREKELVEDVLEIMMSSREINVNYQTPLGLNVLCDFQHYDPKPEVRQYYHRADSNGLGYDRTSDGSGAVDQYFEPLRNVLNNRASCPEEYLAWFHHVPWDFKMESGRSFWEELCYKYYSGVKGVLQMQQSWERVKSSVDPGIFRQTHQLLENQAKEARNWYEVCLDYFSQFSSQEIPLPYRLQ